MDNSFNVAILLLMLVMGGLFVICAIRIFYFIIYGLFNIHIKCFGQINNLCCLSFQKEINIVVEKDISDFKKTCYRYYTWCGCCIYIFCGQCKKNKKKIKPIQYDDIHIIVINPFQSTQIGTISKLTPQNNCEEL